MPAAAFGLEDDDGEGSASDRVPSRYVLVLRDEDVELALDPPKKLPVLDTMPPLALNGFNLDSGGGQLATNAAVATLVEKNSQAARASKFAFAASSTAMA